MKKTVLLIDGNSLAFRAFYAMINQVDRLISHNGLHTNALVAFNNFFDQIIDNIQPDYALVAWDAGKASTTFRGESFDEYKAQRKTTPQELVEQFPYFRKMVELHGVKSYEQNGIEADDIIGTFSRIVNTDEYNVLIYTGDKDLVQLVTENVTVNVTKKGVSELDAFTPKLVSEKYEGLIPSQIIDLKGLTGDASDNYPGVSGIGNKTAIKLLNQFKSIDGIYANIDSLKGKQKENLENDKEIAYQARKLATIITDAKLDIDLKDIAYKGINYDELIPFYEDLDFKVQLAKIHALKKSEHTPTNEIIKNKFIELNESNLEHLKDIDDDFMFYIELDDENYHIANPIAFVIGNNQIGFFVSKNIELINSPIISDLLKSNLKKGTFNAKGLQVFLKYRNIEINNIEFDLLLTSYLLDTNDNDNYFYSIVAKFNEYIDSDEDVYGKGNKFTVPADNLVFNHITQKAIILERLWKSQLEELENRKQLKLYFEIELPLSKVLAGMEFQGILINQDLLLEMGSEFDLQLSQLESDIFNDAGEQFNISSPKQLGELLFEKMNIPPIKKTKTGYSTDAEVLNQLSLHYPFVDKILKYRQISKINSTYVKGMLNAVNKADSKLHTRYLQTLTQTGRLSSIEPNLQNIPDRDDLGKQIRKAFIPSTKGAKILGSDYSQIELRVLAHISKDQNLIESFKNNQDIHDATARRIFNIPEDLPVDFQQRRHAKAVNFGIVYGISDFGLAKSIGISRISAKEMIDNYFHNFSGVKLWIDNTIKEAQKNGFVSTIFNRRRYLPDINSKVFNLRSFAQRTATNSPIQGSAADLIKIAMIKIDQVIKDNSLKTRMLLQIHDELLFEVPDDELEKFISLLKFTMENIVELDAPLKVDVNYGNNWFEEK